jgi:hypothetical protein
LPVRTRRRRNRSGGEVHKHLVGGVLATLAIGVLAAGAYVYATAARPPTLDQTSLCPVDGPRSITVVLLDSTDDIPDIARREVRTALTDLAETLPAYGLLEIRLLDSDAAGGRTVFAKCNPGDGSNLSEYTSNPRLAKKRWMDGFREPLDQALETGFRPLPGKVSPIMETVQRIAVERFTGRAADQVPKQLVLISDMIEHECGGSLLRPVQGLARLPQAAHRPARRRCADLLHPAQHRKAAQFRRSRPLLGGLDPRQ